MILKVWFLDHHHHLGTFWKCLFLGQILVIKLHQKSKTAVTLYFKGRKHYLHNSDANSSLKIMELMENDELRIIWNCLNCSVGKTLISLTCRKKYGRISLENKGKVFGIMYFLASDNSRMFMWRCTGTYWKKRFVS